MDRIRALLRGEHLVIVALSGSGHEVLGFDPKDRPFGEVFPDDNWLEALHSTIHDGVDRKVWACVAGQLGYANTYHVAARPQFDQGPFVASEWFPLHPEGVPEATPDPGDSLARLWDSADDPNAGVWQARHEARYRVRAAFLRGLNGNPD